MTGLVPVIHVVEPPETLGVAGDGAAWMAGTSPAMTENSACVTQHGARAHDLWSQGSVRAGQPAFFSA